MAVYRLWPATSGQPTVVNDPADYTLGVEFYVTSACDFTAWHWWAQAACNPIFSLYQVDSATAGTLVNQVTGTSIASPFGEWKRVPVSVATSLTPNQRYRACITNTSANWYTRISNYWSTGPGSAGITNGPLVAPNSTNATGNDQCSHIVASSPAFPDISLSNVNYWIDVEVSDAAVIPSGSVSITNTETIAIQGVRSPVGSIANTFTGDLVVTGQRVPVGSISLNMSRNVSVIGSIPKVGSASMNMSRNISITGQHPAGVPPPAPGSTRSDVEYNYQQWLYPGPELDPYTMLDYFNVNGEDKSKLNRPPG